MRRQIDSHGLRRFVPARELGGADDLVEEPLTRAVRHEPIVALAGHARVELRLLDVCGEEPPEQETLVRRSQSWPALRMLQRWMNNVPSRSPAGGIEGWPTWL